MERFARIVNGFYPLLFSPNTPSYISDRVLITPLIVYKYCNCKDFVVYLSIILFLKSQLNAVLNADASIKIHLSMVASIRNIANNIFLLLKVCLDFSREYFINWQIFSVMLLTFVGFF